MHIMNNTINVVFGLVFNNTQDNAYNEQINKCSSTDSARFIIAHILSTQGRFFSKT